MNNHISLSVVMPALNEEGNIASAIEDTLQALDSLGITGELIIVDDGSTDATKSIIECYMATDSRVSVVTHKRSLGVGRSFWDGSAVARYEAVVYYPGDNEMIASEMMTYLHLINQTDMVVPYTVNQSVRSTTRQVLSRLYSSFITKLLRIRATYTNGLIIYRRSVLNEVTLQSNGFMFQTEILAKLIRNGYLYSEVPFFIKPRLTGKSKADSFASITGMIKLVTHLTILMREVYSTPAKKIIADSATFRRRESLR